MKFTIYKLINNRTGKTYTGCTRSPKGRIADHFACLKAGRHKCKEMQEDFNKGDEFSFRYVDQFEENRFDNATLVEEQHIDKNTYNVRRNSRSAFRDGHIKKDVLLRIIKDFNLKYKLVVECEVSLPTIDRWLKNNSIHLTMASVLEILQTELRLSREEILERPKQIS